MVLDVGTTQLKAVWFSEDGTRLAASARELSLHAPRPGVAEQSAASIWDAARIAAMVRLGRPVRPRAKDADTYDAEYPAWQTAFFTAAAGVEI